MTEMLSIKLKSELKRRVERAAKRRGVTKSTFARLALEQAVNASESAPIGLDLVRDLVGKYNLPGMNLSHADPGEVIREKFQRKREKDARRDR